MSIPGAARRRLGDGGDPAAAAPLETTVQYMLIITAPMSAEEELVDHGDGYASFYSRHAAAIAGGAALRPADTATTVRLRDSEVLTTDGPFVEAAEQLTGFFLVEAADLDAAIAMAAEIPAAAYGAIEVRPVLPMPAPATA
jgi:hypothetical protein